MGTARPALDRVGDPVGCKFLASHTHLGRYLQRLAGKPGLPGPVSRASSAGLGSSALPSEAGSLRQQTSDRPSTADKVGQSYALVGVARQMQRSLLGS